LNLHPLKLDCENWAEKYGQGMFRTIKY